MQKNKIIYIVLFIAMVIGFWCFENYYGTDFSSQDYDHFDTSELPFEASYLPSTTFNEIILHNHYMLSYSEPYEQAEWVAYQLKRRHLTNDDRKRPYFIEDPKVRTASADWRNYKGSGYDRGHLCPAGDRRFSKEAYNETFYTSNIAPQNREFNAGIWNRLEIQTRKWCRAYGDLYIITGGILKSNLTEIGYEDVDVPNEFYKLVFRFNNEQLQYVAFVIPNQPSNNPLKNYVVTIDELEAKSGLDFFYKKPQQWQSKVESHITLKNWKF
ncbi:MAG: DNA/RNA non-specific endonuclease [Croceitalea sp.]|nr:DNA/RNA non-specific endonuclease [Croceitalea sp.]